MGFLQIGQMDVPTRNILNPVHILNRPVIMSQILNLIGLFCTISGSASGILGAYFNSQTDDHSKLKAFTIWEYYSNPMVAVYLLGLYFKVWEVDLGTILPILMYCAFTYTSHKGRKNCEKKIKSSQHSSEQGKGGQ